MRLTMKRIARLKQPGRYGDGHGLYLQVVNKQNRSWLLRYERGGRERFMGLGPLHAFALQEARERAREARQLLADGIDPLDAKKAERAATAAAAAKTMTFAECAEAYFAQHRQKWRNAKHTRQFLSTLKQYAYAKIGNMAAAGIDTGTVLSVLEQHCPASRGFPAGMFWQTRHSTADRVRARIEAVLEFATVRGYRTGENPARWRGHLRHALPARSEIAQAVHHAAMPYVDLPEFLATLRGRAGIGARALEFLILTAARTNEVIGARRDEIDLEGKIWTVPAGRMKAGREHRVPLSRAAIELLQALPMEDGNTHIFLGPSAGGGLSTMAMPTALKRAGRSDVTIHGFRATFKTWASERTNFPSHVVELALAHTIGNAVERAYRRGDLFEKRRKLMEAWARYCMTNPAASEVIPLRKAR